ncbi:RNA-binding protein required for 60S ribosomal subunit biogenesis [Ruminococcaceae bacterium YRB3002]|nr:RNA-binding protein required for 60S ribosomal subunit biogenesis [Ruminococcaceae bacterium YRB3002]
MIDFYNAFISYKHSPHDIKVAEHVQRNLEHFRIPHAIRKKTGKKRIERVFRDKDELPITSDLTDTISNALKNAEYLIVICSPNSKKSVWVKREIQFFLENHPKNRVLTVLAEGEPEDVIPEELLTEDREFENELGIKYTVKVPVEPLSCDYRMPLSKAKKEELPRLAAAIIGCSYDELVRRQRTYKMKQLGIILSSLLAVAIGFAGYMIYNNNRLDKAYRESLANQSRFLANESSKLLDKEMRIDALHLALAALPQDEDDKRPVMPEAVRALTNATLAYQSEDGLSINSAWDYSMSNRIDAFNISPDGKKLVALDSMDNIRMWNTSDHSIILETKGIDVRGVEFLNNDLLLVWESKKATAYDTTDASVKWTQEAFEGSLDRDTIMFVSEDSFILANQSPSLLLMSMNDGKILHKYDLQESMDGDFIAYSRFDISPDKTKVAFSAYVKISDMVSGIFDLRTGSTRFSESGDGYVNDVIWVDNSHIVTSTSDLSDGSSSRFGNNYVLTDDKTIINCYSAPNMTKLWSQEFISNGVSMANGLLNLQERGAVAYYCGTRCTSYKVSDGTLEYNWTANESLVECNDRDGDGWPSLFTTGGAICYPAPNVGDNYIRSSYELTDDIAMLKVNSGIYLSKRLGLDILYFNTGIYDDEWTNVDDTTTVPYVADSYMDDDMIAIMTKDEGKERLILTDINSNTVKAVIDLPDSNSEGNSMSYGIVGGDKDNIYLCYSSVGEGGFLVVDRSDGTFEQKAISEMYTNVDTFAMMDGGKICYLDKVSYDEQYVRIYDPEEDDSVRFKIPADGSVYLPKLAPQYFSEFGMVYVATEKGDYIINTDKDQSVDVKLPSDWDTTTRVFAFKENKDEEVRFIVSDNTKILIIDKKGKVDYEINCSGMAPLGFAVHPEDKTRLLVAFNDGSLISYNINNGDFLSKSEISTYADVVVPADFQFDIENRLIYIQMEDLIDMVDLDSLIEYSCIENAVGHQKSNDRFYTVAYDTNGVGRLGYFRHYSLQELIDKANNILRGAEISAEMRSQYGL